MLVKPNKKQASSSHLFFYNSKPKILLKKRFSKKTQYNADLQKVIIWKTKKLQLR